MRFEELPLYIAVYEERCNMMANGENPGAEDWTTKEESRRNLTARVTARLFTNVDQAIVDAWIAARKCQTVAGDKKKIDLLVEVALQHGPKCFYANRGKGACSDDVHLDRIIPGSRGGEYTLANCVLSCGLHNTSRGNKSIEEFLQ